MRRVLTVGAILLAFPVMLGGALWAAQERLIFLPDSRALAVPGGWEAASLRSADGLDLAFLVAPPQEPDGAVILHFHGNAGNATDRTRVGAALARAGFGVVLAGYRGYGGNPGRPSEQAFADDARAHLDWTRARFPAARIVLWGESLGTGVVTRLAEGRGDIAAIVLESPFTSVRDLAAAAYPWLPVDALLRHPFESLSRLPRLRAPVLVVASERDGVTPGAHARAMADGAPDGRIVLLPGGMHPAVANDASGEGLRAALAFLREAVR
jgi:pimeloyl-ACP methyl ester carboxylesterase